MRSRPVDLGLLGFETKSVNLDWRLAEILFIGLFNHTFQKKKCEGIPKCRPSRRPVFPWIAVSYSLLNTWHGLKKDRITRDVKTVVLVDRRIMEDELTGSYRAYRESIAFTQKGRRYFAGIGRILDRVNGQSVRRLVGYQGRCWTDVGTVMNPPVS